MIYFRCETSSMFGLGHIKRCISLASSLNKNTSTCFIIKDANSYIIEMIEGVGSHYHKIPDNLSLTDEIKHYPKKSKNIIVDMISQRTVKFLSPYLGYLNKLSKMSFRIVIIEGLGNECIRDTRIPSVEAFIQPYWTNRNQVTPNSKFWFYGKNYVILDSSYKRSFKKRDNNKIENILITFGGSDHQENTLKALEGLNRSAFIDLNFKVVIGPYFLKETLFNLKSIARNFKNINLIKSPKSLRELYKWADLCIGGSSTTRYEAAACGLPMIFCAIYPSHVNLSKDYASFGTAEFIGSADELVPQDWENALNALINSKSKYKKMVKKIEGLNTPIFGADFLGNKLSQIFKQ